MHIKTNEYAFYSFRFYRRTKLSGFQDMECIACGDPPPPYEPNCEHIYLSLLNANILESLRKRIDFRQVTVIADLLFFLSIFWRSVASVLSHFIRNIQSKTYIIKYTMTDIFSVIL